MRAAPVITMVIGAGLLLPFAPAAAQVTTNDSALDSLAAPKRATPHPRPARHTSHPAPTRQAPAPSEASRPAPPATAASPAKPVKPAIPATPPAILALPPAKPVKPAIPATPPAILALPPAVAVPLAHPPPAPVVPLAEDAPGAATPIQNGVRITFGPGRADLSPATAGTLAIFARGMVDQAGTSINVFAYAEGSPDDPSTPRRLSLERALAARAVLMQAGIASARIYPRALGPAGGDQPDRVDVVTGQATPPPAGHAG